MAVRERNDSREPRLLSTYWFCSAGVSGRRRYGLRPVRWRQKNRPVYKRPRCAEWVGVGGRPQYYRRGIKLLSKQ